LTQGQKKREDRKKGKKEEKKVQIRNVTISLLQNETEMDEAYNHIFTSIFTGTDLEGVVTPPVKRSLLTGVHGNKIILYMVEIQGKTSMEFLQKLISNLELDEEQVDRHLSSNLVFSLKLDKQEAYQNRLKVTTSGSECVQILAKFNVYGKKELRREKVLEKLTSL